MISPPSAQVQKLSDDIRLLQLIDRLQFTPEELQQLLPAVDALAAQRAQFDQAAAALDTQLESALGDERALLVADKPITDEIEKRISDLQTQRSATEQQAEQALSTSAAGLRKLLTPPQLAIVTGAYEAMLQARQELEWLRTLSDNDFSEQALGEASGLAVPEKGIDKTLLLNLFTTAHKMNPADFGKSEDEFAQKLAPAYGLSENEANGRLAATFGNAEMPALLRETAAASAGNAG
jgi:hypothetical protein